MATLTTEVICKSFGQKRFRELWRNCRSIKEVATRWLKLFGGKQLVRSVVAEENLSEAQLSAFSSMIDRYRERLVSISWFMRCLNVPVAWWANAEDNVTGRFWEGRFKSQALLDEASVIAVMAYVDLNPIRAGTAETPEESDYTSIQQRVLEQDPGIAARDEASIQSPPEDLGSAIGRLMPTRTRQRPPSHLIIPSAEFRTKSRTISSSSTGPAAPSSKASAAAFRMTSHRSSIRRRSIRTITAGSSTEPSKANSTASSEPSSRCGVSLKTSAGPS